MAAKKSKKRRRKEDIKENVEEIKEEVAVGEKDDDDEEKEKEEKEKEEGKKKQKHEHDDDDDDDDDEKEVKEKTIHIMTSDGRYRNKQRCLVLCSRGVTARYRHLLEDLRILIPHHKKESKLDPGPDGPSKAVYDIAEMRGCNTVVFLECRKRGRDAYLWIGKTGVRSGSGGVGGIGDSDSGGDIMSSSPGPSVRFHLLNIHTMDELKLTGNCMKGSRPILTFDESFTKFTHLKLMKQLFMDVFGTPRGHPHSKPFVDRVMAFCYADQKIWVRNYQILQEQPTNALEAHRIAKQLKQQQQQQYDDSKTSLIEIGPRFVLNPVKIFLGFFQGQIIYTNPNFVSPNESRSWEQEEKGQVYNTRKQQQKQRQLYKEQIVVPENPLDKVFQKTSEEEEAEG